MTERSTKTLSLKEAAQSLGVSVDVVRRAARNGELPAVRVGRAILILRVPFEELLQKGGRL